ncbi:hypothetical protein CIB95_09775 [Lottiidibacillus patelloidae]|uniref:Permease n=1 Tax=Lottiidibacillus patelloidae TaxID=2670334 RepID=A0A263BV51_9BACI|nr:hypothetical protein [Lottiidibacillus patelloidae]OZM57046.1 hypothetical protein CIB95_09775 [Lottiidibacillus patelloidae]
MVKKLVVGLICAIIFTIHFTANGAEEYFTTYLIFSTVIYLALGVPISLYVDKLINEHVKSKSAIITFFISLSLYALAGALLIAVLDIIINLYGFEYIHLLLFGAIAASLFYIIQVIVSKFFFHKSAA